MLNLLNDEFLLIIVVGFIFVLLSILVQSFRTHLSAFCEFLTSECRFGSW
jgi:hypothetical protein